MNSFTDFVVPMLIEKLKGGFEMIDKGRFGEWEDRMKAKSEEEEKRKKEEAERFRQEYLKRTGRKELVP